MNEQLETLFKYIEPAKLLDLGLQAAKFFLVIVVALITPRTLAQARRVL